MKYNWQLNTKQRAKHILVNQLENDKLANFYLFYGPAGTGKESIAQDLIQIIRCQDETNRPCLKCQGCNAVSSQSDSDLMIIEPINGKEIGIKQTRQIKDKINLKSFQKRQIVWIKKADRMSIEAANSILKILEDPSGENRVIFILTADQLNFPKTISSRAQTIYFHPTKIAKQSTDQLEKIIDSTGLNKLAKEIKKSKKDRKKITKLISNYQQLKNMPLTDKIELVNKQLVNYSVKEIIYYFTVYERYKLLKLIKNKKKNQKAKDNLEFLLNMAQISDRPINKKILLKNLVLNIK